MPGTFNLGALPVLLGKNDPVILDIGCNDGAEIAVFLELFEGAKVYAFEPDLRAQESFRQKITDERVDLFATAVSDFDGHYRILC
jgi:FkbM family methyltransferase